MEKAKKKKSKRETCKRARKRKYDGYLNFSDSSRLFSSTGKHIGGGRGRISLVGRDFLTSLNPPPITAWDFSFPLLRPQILSPFSSDFHLNIQRNLGGERDSPTESMATISIHNKSCTRSNGSRRDMSGLRKKDT